MAARENQGYLIAVIILVLLSLVLALVAFLGLQKMAEYADNKAAVEKSLAVEKKVAEANSIKAEILKSMIGEMGGGSVTEIPVQVDALNRLSTATDIDSAGQDRVKVIVKEVQDIQAIYDGLVRANSGTVKDDAAQEITYKWLIDNLSTVLAKKYAEYNIKDRQATAAEQEAKVKIEQMQTEVDQIKQTLATREEELKQEKIAAAAVQRDLKNSLDKGLEDLQNANASYDQLKLVSTGKIDEQANEIAKTEGENSRLKQKVNVYEREVFDKPDGKVVQVMSSLRTVFIDLGSADGLMPNRTFAVYDQAVSNFEKDKHKATVEVVAVGDHQAECRVTDENPLNPIVSGDFVLTATWDPGNSTLMALAGKFDLDSDGFSDLDKLIQLIKRNGGEVVAWHDEQGNIQGEINSSVRYLVLGDAPNLGPDSNPAILAAMRTMEAQAEANTIQKIDLQKLLTLMGQRAKPKVENLGMRDRGDDEFQPRSPNSKKSDDR